MIEVKPRGLNLKRGKPVDVLFFGESPGSEEAVSGYAFTGPSGRHLEEVIENYLPGVSCVLDNVCPRYMEGGKPLVKELKYYAEYRAKSIKRFKPRVIVALGAVALKGLGISASATRNCGGIYRMDSGTTVVVSIHPAFILRDPTQINLWSRVFAGIQSCLSSDAQRHTGRDVRRIDSPAELRVWLERNAKRLCAFDIETTTLDPWQGEILCCSICNGKETIWIPLAHKESWEKKNIRLDLIQHWWPRGPRIVHNLKFELKWMRSLGLDDPEILYDTMLQAWLLNENEPKGLDHLVTTELGHPPYWLDVDLKSPAEIPLEVLGKYNALDSKYTYELFKLQREKLGKVRQRLVDGIVVPVAALLVRMEERGVHVDRTKLEAITKRMKGMAARRLREMGREFPGVNFGSPKQLRNLVFRTLGLNSSVTTDKGARSVKGEVLDKLARKEPRLKKLAEARKIASLINRVLTPWTEAVDEQGIIRTNFNIGQVVTGRLSSNNPNLQNIDRPSKTIKWKGIQREALTSRFENGVIVQLDQMQGELRVQAAVAGDTKFLNAFRNGEDPHQMTADELGCDRSKAKNINFSIIYLISPHGLKERYGIGEREGAGLIHRWYELHPQIRDYQTACFHSVQRLGYVESIFGWRRHLSDMEDEHQRSQAVNFPIQNACVVITYLGMIAVEKMLQKGGYKSLLIHQVHDSIVLDCPRKEARVVAKKAKHIMENLDLKPWVGNRLKHPIPLGVDIKSGEHL